MYVRTRRLVQFDCKNVVVPCINKLGFMNQPIASAKITDYAIADSRISRVLSGVIAWFSPSFT